ncbi:unnamed protein product [Hydatigera taeniaeformis]|uniref:Secreted protein n=1 Tax=Hydatigena taeniaeformis TaxID=6205 RepID=A0A0R3X9J7_HYDTA|nr:unnamed protein product [Hydatigera taeniaeformis]
MPLLHTLAVATSTVTTAAHAASAASGAAIALRKNIGFDGCIRVSGEEAGREEGVETVLCIESGVELPPAGDTASEACRAIWIGAVKDVGPRPVIMFSTSTDQHNSTQVNTSQLKSTQFLLPTPYHCCQ